MKKALLIALASLVILFLIAFLLVKAAIFSVKVAFGVVLPIAVVCFILALFTGRKSRRE